MKQSAETVSGKKQLISKNQNSFIKTSKSVDLGFQNLLLSSAYFFPVVMLAANKSSLSGCASEALGAVQVDSAVAPETEEYVPGPHITHLSFPTIPSPV
jgi:hypothetical protein